MSHKQNKTLKIENIIDTQLTVLGNDISALWEYKGGQEDIHKISRKMSPESTLVRL